MRKNTLLKYNIQRYYVLRGLRVVSVSWSIVSVNVSWTLQWQEVRTAMFTKRWH